jgi:hypothetical protein
MTTPDAREPLTADERARWRDDCMRSIKWADDESPILASGVLRLLDALDACEHVLADAETERDMLAYAREEEKAQREADLSLINIESLGQAVREEWIAYCKETGHTDKPHHLTPWEELSEWDKEADRRIAIAVSERLMSVTRAQRDTDQREANALRGALAEAGGKDATE